ncbi:metal-sulfur cluster assembly factor [uncultured Limosilactobacillus sp.]|uniref:metal-sulfur cluster assembly factor n=1 Tax=uncultured Limosilactobacillus sp. TaxID=2837629 RepID=UPI0025DFC91E|nr:metal-sulfur cluster assembly factor [uncultured Limosilactobacillus sp.]
MTTTRTPEIIKNDIIAELATVVDPELGMDIVNMGFVERIDLDANGICLVELTLEILGCPLTGVLAKRIKEAVMRVSEVTNVDVEFITSPRWTRDRMTDYAKLTLGVF